MKNKIIIGSLVLVGMILIGVDVNAERSWDNKTENENIKWKTEIERWDNIVNVWGEKRDSLHEKYYGRDKYDDRAKYCNEIGCWEESMFYLMFVSKDGHEYKMEKKGDDAKVSFVDNIKWKCVNSGQVLTFNGLKNEFWESANKGQVIEYKNEKGDYWDSRNTGQNTSFKGINGESWKSVNHGQGIEYTNSNGEKWEGSDKDNADDMRWRNRNK